MNQDSNPHFIWTNNVSESFLTTRSSCD